MKTNKGLLGLATGLAVGATLGILFAPDKGTKTRKKIASKTQEAKDKLKDNFDDLVDNISEKYNSLRHDGEEILKNGKEKAKKAVENA